MITRKAFATVTLALSLCFSAASARAQGADPQLSQAEARRLSEAFVAVAEKVSPSVVQIEVTAREENAESLRTFGHGGVDSPLAHSTGSGVVFTTDGAILTNNHVVAEALSINVRLRDGRLLPARLVGRDPATDLAVVRVASGGLVAGKFADSERVRVGEWVVAIGSPFGLGYTVTTGVVSAKGRGGLGVNAIEDYLQTDASINPGNSGGPLCDLEGRVVGINTMIVGKATGIGFAVPSNMARRVADQLLRRGVVERAWLGVGVQDLTPEIALAMHLDAGTGALLNAVTEGGPAHRAMLRPGDVVAAVAGRPVRDGRELIREVMTHEVGEQVPLEVIRGGRHYASKVLLMARPEAPPPPTPGQLQPVSQPGFGMVVRDLSPGQSAQLGLPARVLPLVTAVTVGSAADRAGVRPGDVIVEADGVIDPDTADLQRAAQDGQLLVRVKRKDSYFYAAMRR